jgi:hypothetical protein
MLYPQMPPLTQRVGLTRFGSSDEKLYFEDGLQKALIERALRLSFSASLSMNPIMTMTMLKHPTA